MKLTNKRGKVSNQEQKLQRQSLVVLVATLASYCPNISYLVYEKVSEPTPSMTTYSQYPIEIFALLSSVVDPIVYYWRLKSLRRATKDMLASICTGKKVGYK